MQYTIVILEEDKKPYPRYPQCNMVVPQKALNGQHLATAFCRLGMERKWRQLAEDESWVGTERALTAYGVPLSQSTSLKYMGQVIAVEDVNLLAVVHNLRHARQKW